LAFGYITVRLAVGNLITTIGSEDDDTLETINSVVTMVRYEFPESDGPSAAPPRTTITTEYAELDPSRLIAHGKAARGLR
jgi:hypothetical protein